MTFKRKSWRVCYRVFIKYCVFPRILESLPPLPRRHSAAIGCTKNYQPIGVTVRSHCVESCEGLLQRWRRGRGCSKLWKKHTFSWTPCTFPSLKRSSNFRNFIIKITNKWFRWVLTNPSWRTGKEFVFSYLANNWSSSRERQRGTGGLGN